MSLLVVDSSVVAKWLFPEADSDKARLLVHEAADRGRELVILDLAVVEVANAIWKRYRRGMARIDEAQETKHRTCFNLCWPVL